MTVPTGLHTLAARWRERAPRLVGVARSLFYPCALALVAYMGYHAASEADLASLRPVPLVLAFLTALVWWLGLALGWSFLAGESSHREAMAAWCQTQVARYVPGGIWAVVTRAATVRGRLRDKAAAVTAENVTVLLVSVAVGSAWATARDPRWLPLTLVVAAPVLASRWLERRTRLTRHRVRRTSLTYAVAYGSYGMMSILVQVAVSGTRGGAADLLYVAGAACLAWAVGLVVVIAPGGVGVREVVYVWLLSGLYPTHQLEAAAVVSRVVTVLAELLVLASFWLLTRSARDQQDEEEDEVPSEVPG